VDCIELKEQVANFKTVLFGRYLEAYGEKNQNGIEHSWKNPLLYSNTFFVLP